MDFMWTLILIISITLNILLVWYIKEIVKRLWSVISSKKGFLEEVDAYLAHLKSVYEMEMFYGDETIQNLIEHTRHMSNLLQQYKEVESLMEEENIDETSEEE